MPFSLRISLLFVARLLIGVLLIVFLKPLSVDDYYRMFYANWWWEHPGFTSSYVWLPGHHYLYGPLIGLLGDTIWIPRIFTLFLQLGTAGLLLLAPLGNRQKFVAAAWILFSPLSLVLGTIPLAEAAAFFFLAMCLVFTERFRQDGRVGSVVLAALGLLAATMMRYEMWLFYPAFLLFTWRRRPANIGYLVHWLILGVPLIFPVVWVAFCYASQGEFLAFVFSTRQDHFGQGSLVQMLRSPMGIVSGVQCALVLGMLIARGFPTGFRMQLWTVCFWIATGTVLLISTFNALPSQYTIRVLYGMLFLGSIAAAHWFTRERAIRWNRLLVVMALLFTLSGLGVALRTPMGVDKWNYQAAMWIRAQYDNGKMGADDHTLVSHYLPDCTALYILSNRIDRVHLDAMGSKCSIQFLMPHKPTCPLPDWGDAVQMAVVRKTSFEEEYVRSLKWKKLKELGPWAAYRRPPGTAFPLHRTTEAPGIFLR